MIKCNIIGKECIRYDCIQYNPRTDSCQFNKAVSDIMYQQLTIPSFIRFMNYMVSLVSTMEQSLKDEIKMPKEM